MMCSEETHARICLSHFDMELEEVLQHSKDLSSASAAAASTSKQGRPANMSASCPNVVLLVLGTNRQVSKDPSLCVQLSLLTGFSQRPVLSSTQQWLV